MQPSSDAKLHEIARKRVEFRSHLLVFTVINAVMWGIWYFTGKGYPWPIWPMAIWGVGVIFHFFFEYRQVKFLSEEEEYQKLKKQKEKEEHLVH